jgi:hypothetical protein
MNKKGTLAIETAVIFPMFLILVTVFILLLAKSINYEKKERPELIEGIRLIDSVRRKAQRAGELIE